MPDITMCSNDKCDYRYGCYRFMAEPDRRQSYAKFEGGKSCEAYLPIEKGDVLNPDYICNQKEVQSKSRMKRVKALKGEK